MTDKISGPEAASFYRRLRRRPYVYKIEFPPECPDGDREAVMDKVARLVYDMDRKGWDPLIYGNRLGR